VSDRLRRWLNLGVIRGADPAEEAVKHWGGTSGGLMSSNLIMALVGQPIPSRLRPTMTVVVRMTSYLCWRCDV